MCSLAFGFEAGASQTKSVVFAIEARVRPSESAIRGASGVLSGSRRLKRALQLRFIRRSSLTSAAIGP